MSLTPSPGYSITIRVQIQNRPGALGRLTTAIGRIGCFLTGLDDHTYGIPTSLPWGVDFGDGIPRHPTQIYEIIFLLLLAAMIVRRSQQPHENGDLFKLFMVGYMAFRLLVDFLKPGVTVAGLSLLQWACVAVLVYYARDVRRWIISRASPVPG